MNNLLRKLEVYGVNIAEVLERFLDDKDFYAECFAMFLADPCFAALDKAVAEQDLKAAFSAAHDLKGTSGNLGLAPLFAIANTLVESLRRNDGSQLNEQYAAVLAEKRKLEQIANG